MDLNEQFLQIALAGSAWVLWVLVGISLASAAVVVERFIYYRRIASGERALANALNASAPLTWSRAWGLAERSTTPGAQLLRRTLRAVREGARDVALIHESVRNAQKVRLERNLGLLGTVGANAPFIGLLGTVLEILRVFNLLGAQGVASTQDASAIMTGISEALVATGVGLLVAIPATIAYNAFLKKVAAMLSAAEETATLALELDVDEGAQ